MILSELAWDRQMSPLWDRCVFCLPETKRGVYVSWDRHPINTTPYRVTLTRLPYVAVTRIPYETYQLGQEHKIKEWEKLDALEMLCILEVLMQNGGRVPADQL
jgi:hypothetical protein